MSQERRPGLRLPDLRLQAEKISYRLNPSEWERRLWDRVIAVRGMYGRGCIDEIAYWVKASVPEDPNQMACKVKFQGSDTLHSALVSTDGRLHVLEIIPNSGEEQRVGVNVWKFRGVNYDDTTFDITERTPYVIRWRSPSYPHNDRPWRKEVKYQNPLPREKAYVFAQVLRMHGILVIPELGNQAKTAPSVSGDEEFTG